MIQIWRSGIDTGQGCYLLLFLLNYFFAIIFFNNLYILEVNFPLTFPDITVTAMPVTNCIYNFIHFYLVMAVVKLYRESTKQEYEVSK